MHIVIKHTDKSGLQHIEPNAIYTPVEANSYIEWMDKRFGKVPYTMQINNVLVSGRTDHNKPSILYI